MKSTKVFDRKSLHLQYVTDEAGHKISVVIPVAEFDELLKFIENEIKPAENTKSQLVTSAAPDSTPTPAKIENLPLTDIATPTEFTLEHKISLLKQQYDLLNKVREDLQQYQNAKTELDRKLQIQRLISTLEVEEQGVNRQLALFKKTLKSSVKSSELTRTVINEATYGAEQHLFLLESHYELLHDMLQGLQQHEASKIEGERHRQIQTLANTLEKELQEIRLLVGQLKKLVKTAVLYNVPELPKNLLLHATVFKELKAQLLLQTKDSQRPPLLLQAAGGVGKSVLAAALAHDNEVRQTFPDGIFWIHFGQSPDVLTRQAATIHTLDETISSFIEIEEGNGYLQQLCATRACLFILDDAWDAQDALAFNVVGEHCQLLITTNDKNLFDVVKYFVPTTQHYTLTTFNEKQALQFLSSCVGQQKTLPVKLEDIVKICESSPFAIKLLASTIRNQPPAMWKSLLEDFQNQDYELPDKHPRVLMQAMRISIDGLGERGEYYVTLAVFADYKHIPETAILTLWRYLYQLTDEQIYNFINELADKGLLRVDGTIPHRYISLHAFQYDYLCAEVDLEKLHAHLLAAYRRYCGQHGWLSGPNDGYFFEYLCVHLYRVGRANELRSLLLDFDWLQSKLQATTLYALLNDYELLEDRALDLVKKALYEGAYVLLSNKQELANQLLNHLWDNKQAKDNKDIQALLHQAKEILPNWNWQPHFPDKFL
ncbi:MAG: hypothetical protein BWK79_04615 [Beggiatoa sp. IS2]|nr:MAG: hypothetical protein BWK79_04615 [Beggiatoa sp. IS2]